VTRVNAHSNGGPKKKLKNIACRTLRFSADCTSA